MATLTDRLEKLEEALGVSRRPNTRDKRVQEKMILVLYAEAGARGEEAKFIIAKYGSLEEALRAYGDVDEYSGLGRMTKGEREELQRIKLQMDETRNKLLMST